MIIDGDALTAVTEFLSDGDDKKTNAAHETVADYKNSQEFFFLGSIYYSLLPSNFASYGGDCFSEALIPILNIFLKFIIGAHLC